MEVLDTVGILLVFAVAAWILILFLTLDWQNKNNKASDDLQKKMKSIHRDYHKKMPLFRPNDDSTVAWRSFENNSFCWTGIMVCGFVRCGRSCADSLLEVERKNSPTFTLEYTVILIKMDFGVKNRIH